MKKRQQTHSGVGMVAAGGGCSLIMVVATSLPAGFPRADVCVENFDRGGTIPRPCLKSRTYRKGSVNMRLVVGASC